MDLYIVYLDVVIYLLFYILAREKELKKLKALEKAEAAKLKILPPPNVTGAHTLVMHSLVLYRTLIHWRRMSGYNTLRVPGMDHVGIATQVVVEKKIMRERHLTRHDVGWEEFVNEVWMWKNEYGTIL